jgi:hypothetical protein
MREPPEVTVTRFAPAPPSDQARGLLAYVTIAVNGLRIDGITLRRTARGHLTVSYPERVDAAGRRHALIWPLAPEVRAAIEERVFAAWECELIAPSAREPQDHVPGGATR